MIYKGAYLNGKKHLRTYLGSTLLADYVDVPEPVSGALRDLPFMSGVAIKDVSYVKSRSAYRTIANTHFDKWSSENACKMGRIATSEGVMNYNSPDEFMDFAVENNKLVDWHSGPWSTEMPAWLYAKRNEWTVAQKEAWITNYMTAICERYLVNPKYAGRIVSMDVTNETLGTDGNFKSCQWFTWLPNYVEVTFRAVQPYKNLCAMVMNEFDVEYNVNYANGLIRARDNMAAKGITMHGAGSQMHSVVRLTMSTYRSNLKKLSDAGLKVKLSELDVRLYKGTNNTEQWNYPIDYALFDSRADLQQIHSDFYYNVYKGYYDSVSAPNRLGITTWSVDDLTNFINQSSVRDFPALWTNDLRPKPAVQRIINYAKTIT